MTVRREKGGLEKMNKILSPKVLEVLQEVDSPTVSNAIEALHVRDLITGFAGYGIRCMFPELGVTVGYAITAEVDTTSSGPAAIGRGLREFTKRVEASPKPVVLVYQDVGPRPGGAACIGSYSATLMKRLGAVALVCNGAIRDVNELRALGFQCFALGSAASHGNPRRVRWGGPVVVDGLRVESGDLIHGDRNGVISVPSNIAQKLPAEIDKIRAVEEAAVDLIKSPDFTLDAALKRMGH